MSPRSTPGGPPPAGSERPTGGGGARARRLPRAVAIVPARLGSTRLARKMLLCETGLYLFEHTARRALACPAIERVVVATDSDEVLAAAAEVGLEALATSERHRSGTDRVEEAARILAKRGEGGFDVIVNVQGDEAELPPEDLSTLLAAFLDPAVELATLAAPLESESALADPNVVKVVCDRAGDALYFTRAAVGRHAAHAGGGTSLDHAAHHVGVYAFRPGALERFCALPPGRLERAENLEQLRWLEAGGRIRVLPASRAGSGIDTEEQYRAFVARTRVSNPASTPRT